MDRLHPQRGAIVLPASSGATLRLRKASTPEPDHRQIYRQLEVPERVMAPKRTGTDP